MLNLYKTLSFASCLLFLVGCATPGGGRTTWEVLTEWPEMQAELEAKRQRLSNLSAELARIEEELIFYGGDLYRQREALDEATRSANLSAAEASRQERELATKEAELSAALDEAISLEMDIVNRRQEVDRALTQKDAPDEDKEALRNEIDRLENEVETLTFVVDRTVGDRQEQLETR